MNREPQQFETVRFLVDGSHWTSKKKLKKSDERQKGHLGCSEGMGVEVANTRPVFGQLIKISLL